ncbi:MAG: RidA family protein [Acidobacteriota bacterium]
MPHRVFTADAPSPAGHYSQAIVHRGIVYVAGQLPIDPQSGRRLTGESIEVQAEQALRNLAAVLKEAGSDLEHALKVTVYLSDIALWDRVNTIYAATFGAARPARTVVPCRELHHDLLIEIDAIAAVRE